MGSFDTKTLSVFGQSLLTTLCDYERLFCMKNQLHFGDNLEVMQDMPSESYHLSYLDPPFNSGRNYNIFLSDTKPLKKLSKFSINLFAFFSTYRIILVIYRLIN